MKLVIFGATSATGKLLVEKALTAGHEVIAFVRDESKLEDMSGKLTVICGNALNLSDIEAAVPGADAVLSTLGPKGKPAVMAAESTKNIVAAMEKHGVKRLVVVSVAGIAVPRDQRGFNLIAALLKLLLKDVFRDREQQLEILEGSSLEWIAVRVPRLTNDPSTGSVKAFFGNPSSRRKLSRADLADFMLRQLAEDQWLRQAPILSS
jgi:putative NADH-flavin reductase